MDKKPAENNQRNKKYTVIKAAAVIAAAFAVLAAASYPMKTVFYEMRTDKVTEKLRIAQVSDLHSCAYGKDMETLISAIDGQQPDVVVMTGDIYDDTEDNDNTRKFLKAIAKKYPCIYVAGNHEFRTPEWQKYSLEAQSFGVRVLEGENVKIGGITLCGAARAADGSVTWDESVEKCAETAEGYSVLLCHFPENIEYYRSFGKFDLILCGHAHGGQWRIPYLMNGLYSPGEGLFPKYAGGRYDFPDSTMIVSRGLSRTKETVPRIFNNPELVIIDILPEKEEK